MSPHQNLIRIAPLLGPEFQTLISMLVLEKLDEAYMILFEKKPVSYLPWSHHFQRLVNYYLIHYPPPVSFPSMISIGYLTKLTSNW